MSAVLAHPAAPPSSTALGALFAGLADARRLALLRRLREGGPQTVGELVRACGMRQPSVSKHLACLHGCGLVERDRQGRRVTYALCRPEVGLLLDAAEQVWRVARCGESCSCSCCMERG